MENTLRTALNFALVQNILSYVVVIGPLFLFGYYLKKTHRIMNSKQSSNRLTRFLYLCYIPDVTDEKLLPTVVDSGVLAAKTNQAERFITSFRKKLGLDLPSERRSSVQYYSLLVICATGLQLFYVLWGVMQERIMTRSYDGEMFDSSQFLVFCNRFLSLVIVLLCHCMPLGIVANPLKDGQRAPLLEFSFASVSNILSSWCQYEALKHVSFLTQVLSKACKIVPVMLMGWLIQRRTYTGKEYLTAIMISIGMSLFVLSDTTENNVERHSSSSHATFGTVLILCYMLFDSFTSNWQDRLFRNYKLSTLQVMGGVNCWSLLLAFIPLMLNGTLKSCVLFGARHGEFAWDVLISAICSALGQVFIFFTISCFGPAVFVLIMTLRMGISIIVSCIIFSHSLAPASIFGMVLVFFALFLRMFWRSYAKRDPPVAKQSDSQGN